MAVLIIVVVSIILAVALVVAFILLQRWRRMKATTSAVDNDPSNGPRQSAPPYVGPGAWNPQGPASQPAAYWGQPAPPPQQQGNLGAPNPVHPADPWGTLAALPQQPVANQWGEDRGASLPEPDTQYSAQPGYGEISTWRTLPPLSTQSASPEKLAHEYLQFTAFYSRVVPTMTWNTLLVYAHLEAALQIIREDALKFQEEIGTHPSEGNTWTTLPLLRGTTITVVPTGQGIRFNPERSIFTWVEDWHQIKFRFQVDQRLAGATGNGEITIYAGPLVIGSMKVSMRFVQQSLAPDDEEGKQLVEEPIYLYKRIFTSYSHRDTPIVLACRNVYKALGFESLTDIDTLRSGQRWNTELMKMIDNADLFQLFWSPGAAQSAYVRQEWQYALQRSQEEGFIRPVYWERPLVSPPVELQHLHFAYIELPRLEIPDETPKLPPRGTFVGRVRIEQGKEPGRIYEIRKDVLSIGRSRERDVFLEDVHASRLHASILTTNDGSSVLRDEGSANGTKLNGQWVHKDQMRPLTEGDRIQIGETVLVFLKENVS